MRFILLVIILILAFTLSARAAPPPRTDLFHLSAERVPGGILLGAEVIIRLDQKTLDPSHLTFTWDLAAGGDNPTVQATGPTVFIPLEPGVDELSGTVTAHSYQDGVEIERPINLTLSAPRLSVVRQRGLLLLPPGRLGPDETLVVFPFNFSIPSSRLPISWEQAGAIIQTGISVNAEALRGADAVTVTAGDPELSGEYATLTLPLKP